MKKIILSLAMFAIAMALFIAVIIPLANHGKENGVKVETQINTIDNEISGLGNSIRTK